MPILPSYHLTSDDLIRRLPLFGLLYETMEDFFAYLRKKDFPDGAIGIVRDDIGNPVENLILPKNLADIPTYLLLHRSISLLLYPTNEFQENPHNMIGDFGLAGL